MLADLFPNCVLCMQVISGQLPTHDCKVFAYLIPGHIQHTLVTHQPEEHHGFRSKYRFDKQFLTANVFLHHATAHGIPVWLESLVFSKAFDRVHWPAVSHDMDAVESLWGPLRRSAWQVGISPQLSAIVQKFLA